MTPSEAEHLTADAFSDTQVRLRPRTKVFGIGLHKTSTTTLAAALYILGYDVGGYFDVGDFTCPEDLERFVLEQASARDAVQDMPWPAYYRLLDQQFPNSKFILTERDPDRWIASVTNHFGRRRIPSHEHFYGVPMAQGHERVYRERFREHNEGVRRYFADRPADLLVMDVSGGHAWPELCGFLGLREPTFAFPRQNDGSSRRATRYERNARRLLHRAALRCPGPPRWSAERRVPAMMAYGAVHDVCLRFEGLVDLLPRLGDSPKRHRLEGMLRSWLDAQVAWLRTVDGFEDGIWDSSDLDRWALDDAWWQIELATRRWAGHLIDDGFGAYGPDGRSASAAIRTFVNGGVAAWELIIGALDLEMSEPLPRRAFAPL